MFFKKNTINICLFVLLFVTIISCKKEKTRIVKNSNFPEINDCLSEFKSKYEMISNRTILYFGSNVMVRKQALQYLAGFKTLEFRNWVSEFLQLVALKPTRIQEIKAQYKKFVGNKGSIKKINLTNFKQSKILVTHKETIFCMGDNMSYSADSFTEHLKEANSYLDEMIAKHYYVGMVEVVLMSHTKTLRIKALNYLFLIGFSDVDLIKIWERIPDATNIKAVNKRIKEIIDFKYIKTFGNKKIDF